MSDTAPGSPDIAATLPHFLQVEAGSGRVLSVSDPSLRYMPAALRASLGFQEVSAAVAAAFREDPADRTWIGGVLGRCAPRPEMQAVLGRLKRTELLATSDYLVMPGAPISPLLVPAWQTYRQKLRDITKQSGWPSNIVWPTPPPKA